MNKQKLLWIMILAVCIFTLAPLVMARSNPMPTFVSPVPWCEDTGGVQPCLPWRPTPPPITPTPPPGMENADWTNRVFLPIVLTLDGLHRP